MVAPAATRPLERTFRLRPELSHGKSGKYGDRRDETQREIAAMRNSEEIAMMRNSEGDRRKAKLRGRSPRRDISKGSIPQKVRTRFQQRQRAHAGQSPKATSHN
jgi:hypothetical protein